MTKAQQKHLKNKTEAIKALISKPDNQNAFLQFQELIESYMNHKEESKSALFEELIIWIAQTQDNQYLEIAKTTFFKQLNGNDELLEDFFGQIAEMNNYDIEKNLPLKSVAVAFLCYLGNEYEDNFEKMSEHFCANLVTLTEDDDLLIKLSLIQLFAKHQNPHLKKIITRFGYSTFHTLFEMLFEQKTQSATLSFLKNNLPNIFTADQEIQQILQSTFREFLLKKPDEFITFSNIFSDHVLKLKNEQMQHAFLNHMFSLFGIILSVNNKRYLKEFLLIFDKFLPNTIIDFSLKKIMQTTKMKPEPKKIIETFLQLQESKFSKERNRLLNTLITSKRGRKTSINTDDSNFNIIQITSKIKFLKL